MNNKKCEVCDSVDRVKFVGKSNQYLCFAHKRQVYRYGETKRTKFSKNEIVVNNEKGYAEIILYDKDQNEKDRSLIDIDDVEKVKPFRWNTNNGYPRNVTKKMFLHSFILDRVGVKDNMVVDHINRNRLDNRKSNLRVVSHRTNGFNKGKQSNNTSGYVGVSWEKSRNKWETHIKINRKKIFLGYFDDIEEAASVRKNAEIKYFGCERNEEFDHNTVYRNNNKEET